MLELQQHLSSAQLQLHGKEVQAEKITNLERDNKELSDTFSALRAKQQEEQITRYACLRNSRLRCGGVNVHVTDF